MTKVAVVGAGNWGKNHVKTFAELGHLAAIVEPNKELQKAMKQEFSSIALYEQLEDVLRDDIDAIILATPAHTHYPLAKKALLAGKDVFIEKPLTLSSKEGIDLVTLAKQNKCILMVGHLLLYQPAIQFIKKYLDEGKLGEIVTIKQQRTKLGTVRAVEDVLWSFGVHDIAVLLYLTGRLPTTISVSSQNVLQKSIADNVYIHYKFSDKLNAHLHVSWLYPEDVRKLIIIGTKGMIEYDEHFQTVLLHKKEVNSNLTHEDKGKKLLFVGEKNPLKLECSHFISCIKERTKPLSDGKNGVDVIKVLEVAQKAMKEERRNGK